MKVERITGFLLEVKDPRGARVPGTGLAADLVRLNGRLLAERGEGFRSFGSGPDFIVAFVPDSVAADVLAVIDQHQPVRRKR